MNFTIHVVQFVMTSSICESLGLTYGVGDSRTKLLLGFLIADFGLVKGQLRRIHGIVEHCRLFMLLDINRLALKPQLTPAVQHVNINKYLQITQPGNII